MLGKLRSKRSPLPKIPKGSDSEIFSYKAVSPAGKRETGKMVATTPAAVVAALTREGWTPLEVQATSSSGLDLDLTSWFTGGGAKLKWKDRAEFARRLYQLLRAGISLPKGLMSLGEDAAPEVAEMYENLAERVLSGENLADAMKDHPRAFDEVTISYVEAGEESGTLVETMGRLSAMLSDRASLQSKIKGVTAYPKLIGGTILMLVIGILLFLVPRFEAIYASFDSELPIATRGLVWASSHFAPFSFQSAEIFGFSAFYIKPEFFHIGSFALYIAIGVIIFNRKTRDNPEIGEKLDRIKFKLPVFGNLIKLQALQRWATTLAGGLNSGVPITRALELAAAASGSDWHKNIAPALAERVRTGRTISSELVNHSDLYPPGLRTMVDTGEESGEIAEMLDSVATSLTSDIDAEVAGLSAKIEVALLIVLGVVVGGLLIVLYMPILNLATAASEGL